MAAETFMSYGLWRIKSEAQRGEKYGKYSLAMISPQWLSGRALPW